MVSRWERPSPGGGAAPLALGPARAGHRAVGSSGRPLLDRASELGRLGSDDGNARRRAFAPPARRVRRRRDHHATCESDPTIPRQAAAAARGTGAPLPAGWVQGRAAVCEPAQPVPGPRPGRPRPCHQDGRIREASANGARAPPQRSRTGRGCPARASANEGTDPKRLHWPDARQPSSSPTVTRVRSTGREPAADAGGRMRRPVRPRVLPHLGG